MLNNYNGTKKDAASFPDYFSDSDFSPSDSEHLNQLLKDLDNLGGSDSNRRLDSFFDSDDNYNGHLQDSFDGDDYDSWDTILDDFNRDSDDSYDINDNMNDGFNDDFTDGFNDDFDSDIPYDEQDNAIPERYDEEYSDDAEEEYSDEDEGVFPPKRAAESRSENLVVRAIIAICALAFAIGVLFFIKVSQAANNSDIVSDKDNFGYHTQSDSADPQTVSSQEEPASSEPETSSEPEEKPVYKELKHGDRNDDVLKMQKRLCELGYITERSCTGYFGDFTLKKIKAFQVAAGLKKTGKADPLTLEKLYSDDAPKSK